MPICVINIFHSKNKLYCPFMIKDKTCKIENSESILTIGLQYKNHRGGIGGVIETYSNYFKTFNFVSAYKPQKYKLLIIPYYILNCFKLAWILLTNKNIKIVHIHGAAKGSLVRKYFMFFISKYIFSKKVIYHSHGSELSVFYNSSNSFIKNWMCSFFENVDEIICLSKQWADFFHGNFKVKKLVILENIVEEQPIKEFTRAVDEPLRLLFLGAIGKRKGIFDLLFGLAAHKAKLQGKLILVVGGNGETKKLIDFIDKHELNDIVDFQGWVTGVKKNKLLEESDVYILPSYNEGLPLSILEAMSHSKAIISTNVGGIPEVVKEGLNGFVVDPGDKELMISNIQKLINDPTLVKEMGRASKRLVEPYYSRNVINKLNTIYQDLLRG